MVHCVLKVSTMNNCDLGAAGLAILEEIGHRLDAGRVYQGVHIDGDPAIASAVFTEFLAYEPRTFMSFLTGADMTATLKIRKRILDAELEAIRIAFATRMADTLVSAGRKSSESTLMSLGFPTFAHFVKWFSKPYDELRVHYSMWNRFVACLKHASIGTECEIDASALERYHILSDSERTRMRIVWSTEHASMCIAALGKIGRAIVENAYCAVKSNGFVLRPRMKNASPPSLATERQDDNDEVELIDVVPINGHTGAELLSW
jgi:hypothetical protein